MKSIQSWSYSGCGCGCGGVQAAASCMPSGVITCICSCASTWCHIIISCSYISSGYCHLLNGLTVWDYALYLACHRRLLWWPHLECVTGALMYYKAWIMLRIDIYNAFCCTTSADGLELLKCLWSHQQWTVVTKGIIIVTWLLLRSHIFWD